jgi:hypothetical protein
MVPSLATKKRHHANGQLARGILIGSDGQTDAGKTRFALTCPGNIQMLSVDRNYKDVFESPGIVGTNSNVGIKVFSPPLQGQAKQVDYLQYYKEIRDSLYAALDNPQSNAVVVDGDSDFWEIHILAHFGKTTGIYPQTKYAAPYAEKRAQIAKMADSGKIVICTSKVKDEYETVLKPDGTPEKDNMNEDKRRKTGRFETQGFKDQDYLWNIRIFHMYEPAHVKRIGTRDVEVEAQWGVRITKCKADPRLVGTELWGDDCNFKTLVQTAYPNIPLERWGF